jgi:CRISPR-associated protein (TIGR02584 family)
MTRRILLAVTGLSPQVVTETLYALVTRDKPWIPDEVHLITSQEGYDRIRLALLDPEEGRFHAFCRDYLADKTIDFHTENIHVIIGEAGKELDDIRTPEDNVFAADAIYAVVRKLTRKADTELHVSIAGGRKTMGFYLGYCLSLCARPQDRLSHVLVSAPFENHPDFYFPPREGRLLHTREMKPIHTSDARIMLAEIPFVRLRELLPPSALRENEAFSDVVNAAQSHLETPRLKISLAHKTLYCGSRQMPVRLPQQLFAWYLWLAERACTGETPVRHTDDFYPDGFLRCYARVLGDLGEDGESFENAQTILKSGNLDTLKSFFEQKRSKTNAALVKALGLAAGPYKIAALGLRPQTRYGLTVSGSEIDII